MCLLLPPSSTTNPPHPAPSELAKLLGNRTRALLAFEEPGFEPGAFMAAYLGQLGEKAIDNARRDLGALLATCTEEVGGHCWPQCCWLAAKAHNRQNRLFQATRSSCWPVAALVQPPFDCCCCCCCCCLLAQVESVVQQHHQRFLQACAGVEALEDQVGWLAGWARG
jgi:hypothetical protein